MTTDRLPGYLTIREVARELGLSRERVQQLVHSDCLMCETEGEEGVFGCECCGYSGQRLPGAEKVGGRWQIPESALYYYRRVEASRRGWEKMVKRHERKEAMSKPGPMTETEAVEGKTDV